MIELIADKIKVTGPKADHSYTLSFDMGEYMQLEVCKAMVISPRETILLKIEVATDEDIKRLRK